MKTKCESLPWALTDLAEIAESNRCAAFSALLARISLKLWRPPPGSRPVSCFGYHWNSYWKVNVEVSWLCAPSKIKLGSILKHSFCKTHHVNNFSAKEDCRVEIRRADEYLKRAAAAPSSIFRHFSQRLLHTPGSPRFNAVQAYYAQYLGSGAGGSNFTENHDTGSETGPLRR